MSVKIFHNPRCSKSRQALQLLQSEGIKFEIIEYLKNPLTKDELKNVVDKLEISPEDLLRKNEADFKSNFKGKELSGDQVIQAMIDYPKLMERPIVVNGNKAKVGRPPESIMELF